MKNPLIFATALLLLGGQVQAREEAEAPKRCSEIIAQTVFVPDKTGSRQKGSAKALSESHDNAEAQGWNFEDLDVYIEDGDLQGFFVTYTKRNPCNDKD